MTKQEFLIKTKLLGFRSRLLPTYRDNGWTVFRIVNNRLEYSITGTNEELNNYDFTSDYNNLMRALRNDQ